MKSRKEILHEKIEERSAIKAKRFRDDMLAICKLPEGRRFIFWTLKECGIFQTGFADPERLTYAEGMREIGVKVFNHVMEYCPEKFIQMLKENKADVTIDKRLADELKAENAEDLL